MADLRGVIFVGNGRSADGAAASDGGGVQLDATVDHLRGIGADDITVITADPDAFSAESGLQVQDWNPGEGQVCGLLRAVPRTEEVELLVAEHPLQPTGDFQALARLQQLRARRRPKTRRWAGPSTWSNWSTRSAAA